MARNTQLLQLVDQLRSELGASVNPSQGLNTLATHKYKLKVAQEFLYLDYAWPFLRGAFDVVMQAGERYYDLPADPGGIKRVERFWGTAWFPLNFGIGGQQLSAMNSDTDMRNDPVSHWDYHDTAQFEVWPVPASDACTIRFYGTAALTPLVNDNSRALLDDRLIVLYAAWALSSKEAKATRLADFNSHYNALKKRNTGKSRGFVLGGGAPGGRPLPGPVRVAEANRS